MTLDFNINEMTDEQLDDIAKELLREPRFFGAMERIMPLAASGALINDMDN